MVARRSLRPTSKPQAWTPPNFSISLRLVSGFNDRTCFAVAVMIYGFKFSSLFEITPQTGIVAFTAMVICNLMSTSYFDTRIYRRHFHGKR